MIGSDLFTGQLVKLTAARTEDKDIFASWSHDVEYSRLLDDEPARPRTSEFFVQQDKEDKNRDAHLFEFRIRTLAEDKLIGLTALWLNWSNQVAGLAIGIGDPDYRSKGYGSDAFRLTVNYAFRELNVYRVSIGVFSYNTRAIRVYEKNGFTHEGRLRSALYRDNQRHDFLYMGMLRPEWEQLYLNG
jgi:RimJ/RimL family protein N-acetyltransferase